MARFVFGKMNAQDNTDLVAEVESTNVRMELHYPGCTARIVDVRRNDRVTIEFLLNAAHSAACIDWYSAQLLRRSVVMLPDTRRADALRNHLV